MPGTPSPNETAPALSRRDALRIGIGAAAALITSACRSTPVVDAPRANPARLVNRPGPPTLAPIAGRSSLGFGGGRDGILYVPSSYSPSAPAPLVLMLHGAGQDAEVGIRPFLSLADAAGTILLAPDSRGKTWDFLYGPYGADVAFIDRALAHVFERCAVDPARLTIEGFSDGASYALSLGLTNGDFFSRIVAFSPCILAPAARIGRPRIFISHGTADQILPFERCGRRLAEGLTAAGYAVDFRQFDGPHRVPPEIARVALDWMKR